MLEAWVRDPATPPRVVLRAKICLLASTGVANHAIAVRLGTSRPTVLEWRQRFTESGPAGIAEDAPRGPSSKRLPDEMVRSILDATLNSKPPKGATQWSTRTLGKKMGVAHATIARIWEAHGLQHQRSETAKPSLEKQPKVKHSVRLQGESPMRKTCRGLPANDSLDCKQMTVTCPTSLVPAGMDSSRAQQTYDVLKARIADLACGAQLPSVADIRSELMVSQDTVTRALTQLASQGLIERKHRKGVFVADSQATGEIGIVASHVLLCPNASPAFGQTCLLLRQELHKINPKWGVKLHLGVSMVPGSDFPATLDLLEPTILPRLRGILSFVPLGEVENKLAKAGVPVVYLAAESPFGNGVFMDMKQLLRDGIRHLAESGCRSLALLHSRYVGKKPQNINENAEIAAAAAAENGLIFRNEWIGIEEGGWYEKHGYDLFMRMWDRDKHPDGVMVADDILCHGVLRAIQELGLQLPRDLRLVTHANRGFNFPYPRPVTRVEIDLDVWTDKAVSMLEKLIRGQPPGNAIERIQATLVKGETT